MNTSDWMKRGAQFGGGQSLAWDADPNSADLSPFQRNLADTGLQQARFNRPTTYGPFGQSVVDANGNVTSSFSGPFAGLNENLMTQAADAAATPLDFGQFGQLGTGADAGRQAAQAAYSQSLSRLDPFWQKSEKKLRTNLFQSGMADADAGDSTMDEFGRARNDAYAGAMTGALQTGMQAQQSAFQGNLQARQQAVANALRGKLQPFEELGGMQGFMTQPDVARDNSMMVRDAAFNQMAPVTAHAERERSLNERSSTVLADQWRDRPGEAPGTGERRRRYFESLPPDMREFVTRYAGAGTRLEVPEGWNG